MAKENKVLPYFLSKDGLGVCNRNGTVVLSLENKATAQEACRALNIAFKCGAAHHATRLRTLINYGVG